MQMPSAPSAGHAPTGVRHVVAVSSGKGGVGKTTVSVNLAVSLAKGGRPVGLLDADIYGPNVPMMMGAASEPKIDNGTIEPVQAHGVKMMSLGLIAGEDTPIIWRGPIVGKLIQQFLVDVAWGELDYLVVDLPPGTGDAQLTLAQSVSLSGAVIVTTPQDVALEDVTRSVAMFRKVGVPILGIVENMSYFVCPCCDDRAPLFGEGGGKRVAEHFGLPLLGQIPIRQEICQAGDSGAPVASSESPEAEAFEHLAAEVRCQIDAQDGDAPEITIS